MRNPNTGSEHEKKEDMVKATDSSLAVFIIQWTNENLSKKSQ